MTAKSLLLIKKKIYVNKKICIVIFVYVKYVYIIVKYVNMQQKIDAINFYYKPIKIMTVLKKYVEEKY